MEQISELENSTFPTFKISQYTLNFFCHNLTKYECKNTNKEIIYKILTVIPKFTFGLKVLTSLILFEINKKSSI